MKYSNTIDGLFSLKIDDNNVATVTGDDDQNPVTIQLASDEEATKMIAEFEDGEGELMYADGAVFEKYPELHQFRP